MNFTADELRRRLLSLKASLYSETRGRIDEQLDAAVVACEPERKSAVFQYRFQDWMLNCNDTMHGGIASLLMDTSMGWLASVYSGNEDITPSISLQIRFINPVLPDTHILVSATLEAIKSRIIYASASIASPREPGRTLVSAQGEFYRCRPHTKTELREHIQL